ncbi:MAG TPA: CHAT domain-containing protein [Thermoanaerobaculia bacterium]|nr:CHAT domain-containing protein [Thermoanaerobaculia bacterium]
MTTTHVETVRVLITRPPCIDAAVKRLEELAGTGDASVLSDLAGALYVRAQNDGRPSDLLRSLQAAQRAVQINSNLPAANFNLALAQEALGFTVDARASWAKTGRLDRSGWATEAAGRYDATVRAEARDSALRWDLNKERLSDLATRNDREGVFEMIRRFPAAAQRLVEETLLPQWATAMDQQQRENAARALHEAAVIARELMRSTGDPLLHEGIDRITTCSSAARRSLVKGHLAMQAARTFVRAFRTDEAKLAFRRAARDLARGGSPLRLSAELGYATELMRKEEDRSDARALLLELEAETRDHYGTVWGRVKSNLGYIAQIEGRYLQSIELYDEAMAAYRYARDDEGLGNAHIRKAGIYRVLSNLDAALAESLHANRYKARLLDPGSRNLLTGETAWTMSELGFPRIALDYESAFIDALIEEQRTGPKDDATTTAMRVNRAIALRARAAIRLRLGQRDLALQEIEQATAILPKLGNEISNALRARIAEVRGDAAMANNEPRAAIVAFTEALALSESVRFRTFQAILLARRSEAKRRVGDLAAAAADLQAAIAEVNAEEEALLSTRKRGRNDVQWSAYFSRFQESYGRLIGLLAKEDKRATFAYAEKARAFEPLKLVLELPIADDVVRSLGTGFVNPSTLDTVQASLPAGTFVFEYLTTDDETYVWVVSRDDFDLLILPVGRAKIEDWIRSLQRNAVLERRLRFEQGLDEPFEALLRVPLARMARMKNGNAVSRRLILVPDRSTHGLPFAALRDHRTRRHLIENFPVTVSPSATLYLHALRRDHQLASSRQPPRALLVGNPAFNEELDLAHGLTRLPYARTEALELAAMYAPALPALVDEQATVAAFLAAARSSTIIHLAGHAVVNRYAPFGTLLLMAPTKDHSGLLYADELLTKLQLDQARLVVLAACSSAGGVPVGPEGLAPLVRPFIAAGVPGVVGSLWNINDQRSKKVLIEFHRHYRNGHDAASALQLAQVHFLTHQDEGVPVLAWSAFQAIGFASSPYPRSADTTSGGIE